MSVCGPSPSVPVSDPRPADTETAGTAGHSQEPAPPPPRPCPHTPTPAPPPPPLPPPAPHPHPTHSHPHPHPVPTRTPTPTPARRRCAVSRAAWERGLQVGGTVLSESLADTRSLRRGGAGQGSGSRNAILETEALVPHLRQAARGALGAVAAVQAFRLDYPEGRSPADGWGQRPSGAGRGSTSAPL